MSDLQDKYDKLLEEYTLLKNDYSENTIIQSMNDMKKVYDVQKKKIEKLIDIIDNMSDINKSIKIMLSVISKNTSSYNYAGRYELKYRLEFIQEILDNSFKLKNELYYSELYE